MTNTKAKVLKIQAEDKAFINAVMSMDGWETKTRGTHDAEYEIYLSNLSPDDFKLTYDELLGS